MKLLLCFGDSNTWGLIPKTGSRYPDNIRWTGILQEKLRQDDIHLIEEGLCGRTTAFDEGRFDRRNGLKSLPAILKRHSPDAVVIMLGTNDCKTVYKLSAEKIAEGLERCIDEILKFVTADKVLIVSPIYLGDNVWKQEYDPEFDKHSVKLSHELFGEYMKIAEKKGAGIINAADYVYPSNVDQEHFTAEGHRDFAEMLYETLLEKKTI
ncbi:MAG: arylesterase [Clostridiales bacterium]|nr:arylesterase [Clostridiales bacterium]